MIAGSTFAKTESASSFIDEESVCFGRAKVGAKIVFHKQTVKKGAIQPVAPVGSFPELGQMLFVCFKHIVEHCLNFVCFGSNWMDEQSLIRRLTVTVNRGFHSQ